MVVFCKILLLQQHNQSKCNAGATDIVAVAKRHLTNKRDLVLSFLVLQIKAESKFETFEYKYKKQTQPRIEEQLIQRETWHRWTTW